MFSRKKIIILLFLVIFLIPFFLGGFLKMTEALVPFGGRITGTNWCTCSFGVALTIGPPNPAWRIVVDPVTFQYAYYNYRRGAWALGLYSPGPALCLRISLKGCSIVITGGRVYSIGTSL